MRVYWGYANGAVLALALALDICMRAVGRVTRLVGRAWGWPGGLGARCLVLGDRGRYLCCPSTLPCAHVPHLLCAAPKIARADIVTAHIAHPHPSSIHPSIYPSIHPSIHLSIHPLPPKRLASVKGGGIQPTLSNYPTVNLSTCQTPALQHASLNQSKLLCWAAFIGHARVVCIPGSAGTR
jgi:hypothetical protein